MRILRNKIRTKKNRRICLKNKTKYFRGGSPPKEKCVLCKLHLNKDGYLYPAQCLQKYGEKRCHKICKECWWDPEHGFAIENANHKCPGCVQKIPLKTLSPSKHIVIDLTNES